MSFLDDNVSVESQEVYLDNSKYTNSKITWIVMQQADKHHNKQCKLCRTEGIEKRNEFNTK